jgi:hypothetical protein
MRNSLKSCIIGDKIWVFVIAIVIGAFFSVLTLVLIDSWIKYVLFSFEVSLILVVNLLLNNNFKLGYTKVPFPIRGSKLIPDVILISCSLFLFLFNLLKIDLGLINQVFAFLCVAFLCGYSLLNIFRLTLYFSALESVILSFISSFIFAGFSAIAMLSVTEYVRSILMPIIFVMLGTVSLLRTRRLRKNEDFERPESLSRKIDIIPIILVVGFYFAVFSFIYPNAAEIFGTDISRHFNYSLVLSRSPHLYSAYSYILFHGFESSIHTLAASAQHPESILTILVVLNVLIPLSVYALAKKFFGQIDVRIAGISILFYAFLSNLSFIYFLGVKLSDQPYGVVIKEVSEKSYFGIANLLQQFLYFVPLSVSLIIFIFCFLLLKEHSLPRSKFVPILAIFIMAMYFVHVSEALFFVILLSIYLLIQRNRFTRLTDASSSSLIALVGIIIISLVLPYYLSYNSNDNENRVIPPITLPLVSAVFVFICVLLRLKVLPRIANKIIPYHKERIWSFVPLILTGVYLSGLIIWFFSKDFKSSPIIDIGIIPWFIYPMLLGIIGLLSIISLKAVPLMEDKRSLFIFVTVLVVAFALGKILSYINTSIYLTDYWEKRFPSIIFIFASPLATIPIIRFRDFISLKKKRLGVVLVVLIVSMIVVVGNSSLSTQIEYWHLSAQNEKKIVSKAESAALQYLRNILHEHHNSFVISPSKTSNYVLAFAAPEYIFTKPDILISSRYPETALSTLSLGKFENTYLYIHNRDLQDLNKFSDSWLSSHSIKMLPVIFSNEEVKIFNASGVTFPQAKSNTALVIPHKPIYDSWLYLYDIVSQSGKNYTVIYDNDRNILYKKNVIMDTNLLSNNSFLINFVGSQSNNSNFHVIAGNWDFTNAGLQGKANFHDPFIKKNIITSPYNSASDLSISLLFKMRDLDPKIFSYVSLVTSWLNVNNYEHAGVAITDDSVSAYFGGFKDGKPFFQPKFPFLSTNMKYRLGNTINLTVSFNGNAEDLFINGTKYLHRLNQVNRGDIAISFSRAQDILFEKLTITNTGGSNAESIAQYLEFVKKGGNLYVFDTNAQDFIKSTIATGHTNSIMKNKTFYEQSDNSIYKKMSSSLPVSETDDTLKETFSAVEVPFGKGRIIYVDLYPILEKYYAREISGQALYHTLQEISNILNEDNIKSSSQFNVRESQAIFSHLSGKGITAIGSPSVIFPDNLMLKKVLIYSDNKSIALTNVSHINMRDYLDVRVVSSRIDLQNGRGLYSDISFPDRPVNFMFRGNSTAHIISEGVPRDINHVNRLEIISNTLTHLYVRQPDISINGTAKFKGLFADKLLYRDLGTRGSDVIIRGTLSSSIVMSDYYTIASNLNVQGSVNNLVNNINQESSLVPNKIVFDVYSQPSLVRALFTIPFVLTAVLLYYRKII